MWRLILLPVWLGTYFALIWIPLYLLGWLLIPIAALCDAYYLDPATGLYHFTWPIMGIYDNASDGIACNDYWPTITNMYSRIWRWSCNRNPLASITKIPLIHCAIMPSKVGFRGSFTSFTTYQLNTLPCWFVAWQGLFSCIYWQFNYKGALYLLWIGVKIKPTDIYGVEAYRTPRTYNTIQFSQQN
jgi:hypothetical protein